MPERIGLVGFVNTEEILADTIKLQTPDVVVDGYEVLPNEAFGRIVDKRFPLYGVNDSDEFGFHNLERLNQISHLGYAAVNLGPIPAAFIAGETIDATGYDYVGPRRNELSYELDKTKITEIFSENTGILPSTKVLESADMKEVSAVIDELGGRVVIKFVGEYPKYYKDSETRRVRLIEEFQDSSELEEFIRNSITDSGKVVVQKFVDGQQFSYTCLVDGNGGIFSLGEDICFKHRYDGEQGPLCDGTGAVTVNNTLPDLISPDDSKFIEQAVVDPYCMFFGEQFGKMPKTFLNLDLVKGNDGKIYLLEVNHREAGGHTMANLLAGLETPLADAFQATQEGRLRELRPVYKPGASVAVSAYPENFPYPFKDEESRPVLTIPKLKQADLVRIYTGWVDVLSETEDSVVAKTQLSPTMLFVNHSVNIETARRNVYQRIKEVVPEGFAYRTDIGKLIK